MWRSLIAGTLILTAICSSARSDTIVINGVTHSNVKIVTVGTRYYVKFPDGEVTVVEQTDIQPWEIAIGGASLPESPDSQLVPDSEPDPEPETLPEPEPIVEPPPETLIEETTPAVKNTEASHIEPVTEPTVVPSPPTAPPLPEPLPLPPLVTKVGILEAGAKRMVVADSSDSSERIEINALVLRVGDNTVAFCSLDAAAVGDNLIAGVTRRLEAAESLIGQGNLFLAATGVPTGRYPGLSEEPSIETALELFNPNSVNEAADHITLCITDAVRSLAPATLRVAEAEAPQYHKVRGAGSTTEDSALSVMAIATSDGTPLAYVVNYALNPPVTNGTEYTSRRGAPGALAESLRTACDSPVPVLFFNGAAGDIEPIPPAGEDVTTQEFSLGEALARAALSALENAPSHSEIRLAQRARQAYMPPTLLDKLLPNKVLLHEAWINDTVFLSIPGIPAAQIGLLLRVQGYQAGADQAFLLSLCGGYQGFQPTIEEFFVVTNTARYSFYGPLYVRWFSENFLTDKPDDSKPLWTNVRALERYAAGFATAQDRGTTERAEIIEAWRKAEDNIDSVAKALIENEIPSVFAETNEESLARAIRAQLAATIIRERYAGFTGEERAILMGIAEGAHLPFDAVLWLQVLSEPGLLPEEVLDSLNEAQDMGMDFLPG